MASTSGKAAHSSFASSAAAKQATAVHGRPVIQHSSEAKHRQRGQHDAAAPDVVHGFGLQRVYREQRGCDKRRALRQKPA